MNRKPSKFKRVTIPGVSIWPQPKPSPRSRYRISYMLSGKRKTEYASTDLTTTLRRAWEISERLENIRTGQVTAAQDAMNVSRRLPLETHFKDYEKYLSDLNRTRPHVSQLVRYARLMLLGNLDDPIATGRGHSKRNSEVRLPGIANLVEDITFEGIASQAAKVFDIRSVATANRYVEAVQCFLNWGVKCNRWQKNPVKAFHRFKGNPKHPRRIVEVDDLYKLLAITETGPVRRGLTGEQRVTLYETCLATSIRVGAARQLQVQHFRLEAIDPRIELPISLAKGKREQTISLPESLAVKLRCVVTGKQQSDRVFCVPSNAAKMLQADLRAAGIPYRTEQGFFDFHAVRHQSGTMLAMAGVTPKVLQQHMGHTSIKMTLDTYGHVYDQSRREPAVVMGNILAQRSAQRKAGSEGRSGSPTFAEEKKNPPENAGDREWSQRDASRIFRRRNPRNRRENAGDAACVGSRRAQRS